MPAWLDQLLVFALLTGALAYLWWTAHRKRVAPHGTGNGAPPCAGGCCPPKPPPHLGGSGATPSKKPRP